MPVRYAYVKPNNVVEELDRVLSRSGPPPEGGPEAYVAHILRLAGAAPVLLISTHFHPWHADQEYRGERVQAVSLYWRSRWLRPLGARFAAHPLATFGTRAWGACRIFVRLVRFRPDRVLCWSTSFALWATYLAARWRGAAFVYCRHNRMMQANDPWYRRITQAVDLWIVRRAPAVVVHGPYLRDQVRQLGVHPARIFEFNWSFRHLVAGADRGDVREPPSRRILFVGRLEAHKGVFDLLDACRERLQHDRSVRLVYAGDGTERAALEARVRAYGLDGRVVLLGRVPHDRLAGVIERSRFVVTPTRRAFPEGRCMAAIEALVLGKPVVAPDFGPFPYLVQPGQNGLLFEPDSTASLRHAIETMLEDAERYSRLCAGAARSAARLRASSGPNFYQAVRAAFEACDARMAPRARKVKERKRVAARASRE